MVQQMMEKFNEYRLVSSGTGVAAGDKLQPVTEKESAITDLSSKSRNKIPIAVANSPLTKDVGPITASGTKGQPTLNPAHSQPAGASGTNGHIVYVRRRPETESAKTDSSHSALAKKPRLGCGSDPKSQPGSVQEIRAAFPVSTSNLSDPLKTSSGDSTPTYTPGKPLIGLQAPAPNYSTVPTATPIRPEKQRIATGVSSQPETQRVTAGVTAQPEPQKNDQHWEERFFRLQMFLKSCDESSQQEYMQQLRSLPAAVRSKHAYELERRAIQLSVEEAKELQRMKFLNVLRKALPDGPSPGTQINSSD